MGSRGRRGILLALFGIGLVVVGIVVISSILRQNLAPLPPPTAPPPVTQPVVVTTHAIAVGALLQPEDLAVVDVPVELVPPSVIGEISAAAGRITKIALVAGEIVMPHHLADPTNVNHDLAFVIGDQQVLMAIPTTDLMSQIKILEPGDLVDILASIKIEVMPTPSGFQVGPQPTVEPVEKLFTFDALQRVTISAVVVEIIQNRASSASASASAESAAAGAQGTPAPQPTPDPSTIQPQALLLALAPQDALVLKHLQDDGAIFDIVLRAPTSSQLFELDPVMSEYLIERYELEYLR